MNGSMARVRLRRRPFLCGLGLALGGLVLEASAGEAFGATGAERLGFGEVPRGAFSPNVFVHVAPDGWVTFVCHRSEMGQGVRSSLPVLMADELGADMAKVRITQADGDAVYGDQNTDGSSSVRGHYDATRRVAATARTLLVNAAARRWGVEPESCVAKDHRVTHSPSGRFFEFGALVPFAKKERRPAAGTVQQDWMPLQLCRQLRKQLPNLLDSFPHTDRLAHFSYKHTCRWQGLRMTAS